MDKNELEKELSKEIAILVVLWVLNMMVHRLKVLEKKIISIG